MFHFSSQASESKRKMLTDTPQEQFANDFLFDSDIVSNDRPDNLSESKHKIMEQMMRSICKLVGPAKFLQMLPPHAQANTQKHGITIECIPTLPKGAKYMYFHERKRVIVIVFCQTSEVMAVQFGASIYHKEDWKTKGYITKAEAKAAYKTHRFTALHRFNNSFVTVSCPPSVINQKNTRYTMKDSIIEHELRPFLRNTIMTTGCKWFQGIRPDIIVHTRNDCAMDSWSKFDRADYFSYKNTSWRFTTPSHPSVIIEDAFSLRDAMSRYITQI
jgi:hypothetical protein